MESSDVHLGNNIVIIKVQIFLSLIAIYCFVDCLFRGEMVSILGAKRVLMIGMTRTGGENNPVWKWNGDNTNQVNRRSS